MGTYSNDELRINMKGRITMKNLIDFNEHELIVTKTDEIMIHYLKKPETTTNCVKFINTNGIMAVTGDFGNWIFCREFHPSKDGKPCSSYWSEKLRYASTQDPYEFDATSAKEEIGELKKEHELSDEEIEWLNELACAADEGEYEFIAKAMDRPSSFESEMIPRGKIYCSWFEAILAAFEEICSRL
jgi:hypothetical protein